MAQPMQQTSNRLGRSHGALAIAILVLLVVSAAAVANSMTKPIGRDEQMYCTAGVLLSTGKLIYRDFAYISHPPCHPLLLAGVYQVVPTTHYLLVGRLVSVFCDIATMVLILAIYRRIFGRHRSAGLSLGAAAVALHAFNPLVDYASGYAWNHDVVIACVMLSIWLFVGADFQQGPRRWRIALIGFLLALATCMRATTILVVLLFLVALVVCAPGRLRERAWAAGPFLAGSLLPAVPPIWIFAQASRAMWLDVIHIPVLCARWLQEIGLVFGKAALTVACLKTPPYVALVAIVACAILMGVRQRSSLSQAERRNAIVIGLLVVVFFVIAYIPLAIWRQYLAMPVPLLAIVPAYPLVALRRRADERGDGKPFKIAGTVMALCVLVVVLTNSVVVSRCSALLAPGRWVPLTTHSISEDIAQRAPRPKRVLTLGPLYALEGGCDIYAELACSFTYRVADSMSAEERALTHTVGPATLEALIDRSPPAVVLVGVEPSYMSFLEEPLRAIIEPNWPSQTYDNGLQAYFRP